MRNKTLEETCQDAVKYVIETLDIERVLVVKKERDERRAEAKICAGIETDIENKSREIALLLSADIIRISGLATSIESQLYEWLSKIRMDGYLNKTRLEIELDNDTKIKEIKK